MLCPKESPPLNDFQWKIKKKMTAEKRIKSIKFVVETAVNVYAILEKKHNGMVRERNSIKDALETMTKIMHSSDISEQLDMILHG